WNIFNFWKKKSPVKTSSVSKNKALTLVYGIVLLQISIMALYFFIRRRGNNGGSRPRPNRGERLSDLRPACRENDLDKVKRILGNVTLREADPIDDGGVVSFGERNNDHLQLRGGGDLYGQSILDVVCERGHDEIFKVLVRKEVSSGIDYEKRLCKNPIHVACSHGRVELVRWLVEEMNFDVNVKGIGGFTSLHKAIENGHLEIVRYLISKDANINVRAKETCKKYKNMLPLDMARQKGNKEIVQELLKHNGNVLNAPKDKIKQSKEKTKQKEKKPKLGNKNKRNKSKTIEKFVKIVK
ncbi:ankyrin repeat domain-containing protein, partial [Candidatus Dependentiae bacterium]